MNKYINADRLCEDLMTRWKIADEKKEKEIQSIMADVVVPIVVGQPYADVVEVVRCKDCKHLFEIDPDNLYVCDRIDYGMDGDPSYLSPENDFCSRGERKETE